MAFVFGLLAIYQDEQEIVYEQLKEVLEGGRDPVRFPPFRLKLTALRFLQIVSVDILRYGQTH